MENEIAVKLHEICYELKKDGLSSVYVATGNTFMHDKQNRAVIFSHFAERNKADCAAVKVVELFKINGYKNVTLKTRDVSEYLKEYIIEY